MQRKFKNILFSSLVVVAMLSFTACSKDDNKSTQSTTETAMTEENNVEEMETEADSNKNSYEDMVGKTVSDAMAAGYTYQGYMGLNGEYDFYFSSEEIAPEIKEAVEELEGANMQTLIDKDISLGYVGMNGEYTFTGSWDSVEISFKIEGSSDVMEKYKDESFLDIEDIEEFKEMSVSDVKISSIKYTAKLDESVNQIVESEDFGFDTAENMLKDCVITEFGYTFNN